MSAPVTEKFKAANKAIRAEIERLICLYIGKGEETHESTAEERYQLIFNQGLRYLEIMEGDPNTGGEIYERFTKIIEDAAYWHWWQTWWFARDLQFRQKVIRTQGCIGLRVNTPAKRKAYYERWHDAEDVSKGTPIDKSYYQFLEIQEL